MRMIDIYEGLRDYEKAFDADKRLRIKTENWEYEITQSKTHLVEERVTTQNEKKKARKTIIELFTALLSLSILTFMLNQYLHKKNKQVKALYTNILKEKEKLQRTLEDGTLVNNDDIAIISDRLSILNGIVLNSNIGHDIISIPNNKLTALRADRNEILLTLAALYSCSHPRFIKSLRDNGLTSKERGFCCLYLLGLSTKDLNNTLFLGTGYKHNNIIRKKLGITSTNINLATYLKELDESARQIDESATKG